MTTRNNAHAAAVVLTMSDRVGFQVARVSADIVWLKTPAAVFNAVDHVRRAGLESARAEQVSGQWAIRVPD